MTGILKELINKRKIIEIRPDKELIIKEIKASEYDLESALESLKREDYKWAIIQGYYSMFHSARALLFNKGYREKSHRALAEALRELYVKNNILEESILRAFRECMDLREEADYGHIYTGESAEEAVENAEIFLNKVKQILKQLINNSL